MKTAVVYYSLEGNTRAVALAVAEALGADMLELKPKKPYPDKGFAKFFLGGKAATFKERPALEPYDFHAADYDRIVLGTPLWAGTVTPPLRTFLTQNRLEGKAVAAFICCGGGKTDKGFAALEALLGAPLCAKCTVANALSAGDALAEQIKTFCESL